MDDPQLTLFALAGDPYVLAARGEIHLSTAPQLAEALEQAIDAGRTHIVMDLSETGFIDSTGLSVLLNAVRRLDGLGGRLVVACSNPTVLRLFEITGLQQTLEIVPDPETAAARVQAGADSSAGAP